MTSLPEAEASHHAKSAQELHRTTQRTLGGALYVDTIWASREQPLVVVAACYTVRAVLLRPLARLVTWYVAKQGAR